MRSWVCAFGVFVLVGSAAAQQTPTPAAKPWWDLTVALSNDEMQGRDTGTEAYERAAKLVAEHFKADGLTPAGDNGTFLQRVPMHEVDLDTAHSSVEIVDAVGAYTPLALLYDVTVAPRKDLPSMTEGKLVWLGYGDAPAGMDLKGKIAVYFNGMPADVTAEKRASVMAARMHLATAGVAGVVSIDNPAAIEPSHWPAAYARTVTLVGAAGRGGGGGTLTLRVSAESGGKLFAGTGADWEAMLAAAEKGAPLEAMELKRSLRVALKVTEKEISSPNVIAVLPGSDATLKSEYVAVSAHLDGYGYGTPVLGDNLYNGALDDAAYVATLEQLADELHGHAPKRSILFCVFTGEEKGLLGSVYYTQHLTVAKEKIVADLNLDQLRPIFPLKILTMEGITDSTLGDTAKSVAAKYGIELRPDRETERNLFRRADNYSFVRIGVPIASFIFGYDPGTESERVYRDWYARRYHKPQDDIATPIVWDAAVKFNDFYRSLTVAVADASARPQWAADSPNAPK